MKINNFSEHIKETKKSALIQPSDKEIEDGEKYLKEGVDPSWDQTKFGFFYIDISGKYAVYYTLWRFKPGVATPYHFITNLSIDFKTAIEKAKKAAGRVPVIIDRFGTQAGMFRTAKSELITFGKYRGKTLGDVFIENPQYIAWLYKNYDGKSPDRFERIKYYYDIYLETITKKNIEESKSQFVGKIGDKITIEVDVYSVERLGFQTQIDFNNKCKMIDDAGNKYMTYNLGTNKDVQKGDKVKVTAKVKDHKEYLGIKFTTLNYCKIIWNQREDLAKYNL
jgi:hypothetical protein